MYGHTGFVVFDEAKQTFTDQYIAEAVDIATAVETQFVPPQFPDLVLVAQDLKGGILIIRGAAVDAVDILKQEIE